MAKLPRLFCKVSKEKSGQATKKKHLYHDNLTFLLKFLLKVVQSDDTESSINGSQHKHHSQLSEPQDADEVEVEIEVQAQRNVGARPKKGRETTKKPRLQELDQRILRALEHPRDEDEAFFISITPSVRKMSEEDKLEFRVNVLQLIRRQNNYQLSRLVSVCPSRAAFYM
ncbi:hypothetical protein MML48_1g12733 [Holotrichia oblita]|uniref:Uncharacterized protein n=1 Tax=Holotrichia oblita TaxID=644536 RepID=A0ACB9TUW7_HOLOL|nr:hypothetical protein MML48_1g12733 [Holotrichia oblita]